MTCDTADMEPDPERRVTRADDRSRWELTVDGVVVAFADFNDRDGTLTIPYIETAPEYRGRGHSGALMDGVIDDLRRRNLVVRAPCPVARAHLAEHAPDLLER